MTVFLVSLGELNLTIGIKIYILNSYQYSNCLPENIVSLIFYCIKMPALTQDQKNFRKKPKPIAYSTVYMPFYPLPCNPVTT